MIDANIRGVIDCARLCELTKRDTGWSSEPALTTALLSLQPTLHEYSGLLQKFCGTLNKDLIRRYLKLVKNHWERSRLQQDTRIPDTCCLPKAGSAIHQDHAHHYWTLRNKLLVASIVISAVSICFSAASVGLALWALTKSIENQRQSIDNQRDLKGIDLLVTFQKRYDELAYDIRSKVDSDERATEYYHRFWDLQFEQYQYWKVGMIQPEIYGSWMEFRRQEFVRNYKIRRLPSRMAGSRARTICSRVTQIDLGTTRSSRISWMASSGAKSGDINLRRSRRAHTPLVLAFSPGKLTSHAH